MAADPVVSPADTIRARLNVACRKSTGPFAGEWEIVPDEESLTALDALLAVGERDKAEREQAEKEAAELRQSLIVQERQWIAASQSVGAERERDRQQIARLTEAVDTLKNGPLRGILETYRQEHPDDGLALSTVIAEIQEITAVLAGEEDASDE